MKPFTWGDLAAIVLLTSPLMLMFYCKIRQEMRGAVLVRYGRWRVKMGERELSRGTKYIRFMKSARYQKRFLFWWVTMKWRDDLDPEQFKPKFYTGCQALITRTGPPHFFDVGQSVICVYIEPGAAYVEYKAFAGRWVPYTDMQPDPFWQKIREHNERNGDGERKQIRYSKTK